MIDINNVLQQYRDAAILHGASSLNGDYKIANQSAVVLKKIYHKLGKDLESQKDIFDILLADEDPSIATWSAAHCLGLGIYQRRAVEVLKKISRKKDIGILSFNAEMTFKAWKEQGYLKF